MRILEEFGLTENESKVYLALLNLGPASAGEIIQKVGLHRAVVYDLLERLKEKGLIGSVLKGKKRYFESTSPKRFIEIIKEKENELKRKESDFMKILPELEELSGFKSELEVTIYKGKEGLKTIFEDVLLSKEKEWLGIGTGGIVPQVLPYYLETYHKRRIKQGVKIKTIFARTEEGEKRGKEFMKMPLTEVKFLPKSIQKPSTIQVYGNKTAIYSSSNGIPFIVLINNKEISLSFRAYFDILWNVAKK